MKKAVSILLAAALILCMGVPVYAEPITVNQGSASSEVTGTYVPGTAGGTVFSVEITWSGLSFTYNGESKQVWDPTNLVYTGEARSEGWAESNAAITVKNRSNTIITATPNYEKADDYADAGMEFAVKELYVRSAEPTGEATTGEEKSGSITVTPTGTLPEGTKDTTIGTITVTITEFKNVSKQDVQDLGDYINEELSKYYVKAEEIESLSPGTQYYDPGQLAEIADRQDILYQGFDTLSQDERNQQYIEVWDLINQLEILTKE